MIEHPFSLLQSYKNTLQVALLTKADDIQADNQAAALVQANALASVDQVHGSKTVIVRESTTREIEADGLITDVVDLTLTIRWADCQNFVIFAPKHRVTGLLHAGWRGLNSGAIPEFFKVLQKEFGIDASDVLVGAGPSLCTTCASFTDPNTELANIDPKYFQGRCVDLRQAATDQFLEAGVPPSAFERLPDCTRCMPEKYWTFRGGDKEAVIKGKSNMLACTLLRSEYRSN